MAKASRALDFSKWRVPKKWILSRLCVLAGSFGCLALMLSLTSFSLKGELKISSSCSSSSGTESYPTCRPCTGRHSESRTKSPSARQVPWGVKKDSSRGSMQDYSVLVRERDHGKKPLPTIYAVTPTYKRPTQMAELTRLAQTLAHISLLTWVVVDDGAELNREVHDFLRYTKLNYTYLAADKNEEPTTQKYKTKRIPPPRGVACRMTGLKWIRQNAVDAGVVYFADDDNTYDLRIFHEMRWTKKVSMWPVGLVSSYGISTPIVDLRKGQIVGFYDGWVANRIFPVDMAGFAVSVRLIRERPKASMPYRAGFEEDGFLQSLGVRLEDIEPKASNCTKVLVWHTRTTWDPIEQQDFSPELLLHTNLQDVLRTFLS